MVITVNEWQNNTLKVKNEYFNRLCLAGFQYANTIQPTESSNVPWNKCSSAKVLFSFLPLLTERLYLCPNKLLSFPLFSFWTRVWGMRGCHRADRSIWALSTVLAIPISPFDCRLYSCCASDCDTTHTQTCTYISLQKGVAVGCAHGFTGLHVRHIWECNVLKPTQDM